MNNKKKKGRPPMSDKSKTIRFGIRLNEDEHQEFIKKAAKKGMTVADYIRYLVKKDK